MQGVPDEHAPLEHLLHLGPHVAARGGNGGGSAVSRDGRARCDGDGDGGGSRAPHLKDGAPRRLAGVTPEYLVRKSVTLPAGRQ